MQLSLLDGMEDLPIEGEKILIGLSGGINSAAVLCYLKKHIRQRPAELHLFYAHFEEHSPDTERFVLDLVKYAKANFENVYYKQTNNSILKTFEEEFKGIPHPMISPCTRLLKIMPITEYMYENQITTDLVGYVRQEKQRIKNQQKRARKDGITKAYPIAHMSDEDCFSLVKAELGWYPAIYDIKWNNKAILPYLQRFKKEMGNAHKTAHKYAARGYGHNGSTRVFAHNNCLPCKNMQSWEYWVLRLFFPNYYERAAKVAEKLDSHWGRSNADAPSTCTYCEN